MGAVSYTFEVRFTGATSRSFATAVRNAARRSPRFDPSPMTTRTSGRITFELQRIGELARVTAVHLAVLHEEEERRVLHAADVRVDLDLAARVRVEMHVDRVRGRARRRGDRLRVGLLNVVALRLAADREVRDLPRDRAHLQRDRK